jgi:predicted phosphodiesterase
VKIHIVSDLHLEFGDYIFPSVERDLLILAGDIDVGTRSVRFLKEQLQLSPVLYVLGNHEFYNNDVNTIITYYEALNLPGLHFLQNSVYQTNQIRFLGCPLWTDVNHQNKIDIQNIARGLNDFLVIQNGYRPFTVEDSIERHFISVNWLKMELNKPFEGKTVVITHHMPNMQSVVPKYKTSQLNYGFASNLDQFILDTQPDVWIHGHTHDSVEYQLGETHIICNPRGYPHEANPDFDPCLTLDV